MSLSFRDDLRRFLVLLFKLELVAVATGVVVFFVAYLFGEWLLRVFYRPEYAAYQPELLIIVLAQCIMLVTSNLGLAATLMRVYWFQVVVWCLMCAVAWCASTWLIPQDPIRGGAKAMLAVALVQLVVYSLAIIYGIVRRPALVRKLEAGRWPSKPADFADPE